MRRTKLTRKRRKFKVTYFDVLKGMRMWYRGKWYKDQEDAVKACERLIRYEHSTHEEDRRRRDYKVTGVKI